MCVCVLILFFFFLNLDLLAFKTLEVLHVDEEKGMEKRSQTVIENFPVLKNLTLSGQILNIATSCDDLTLLVVMEMATNVQLLFFDIRVFCLPVSPFILFFVLFVLLSFKDNQIVHKITYRVKVCKKKKKSFVESEWIIIIIVVVVFRCVYEITFRIKVC